MLPHSLPAAIESTLRDAGFSATEILIIRKMLEHDALTLRELAMKTGKSTGVLDQAIKHLITRKIIERVVINSVPKYALKSLRAIGTWLREDMTEKQASLRRRHDNMEKFLSSLSLDRHRPDMEYFEGRAGIQEAYDRLLATRAEFLTRSNPTTLVEEDPLREMRVQLFRRRQVHHVFQRVLSPDTHFARRHQSRDHFEYRSTQLLPPVHTSSQMEVTIAGDLICCIDVQEERACIIRYPELAKDEKERFEREWAEARELAKRDKATTEQQAPAISACTSTLSNFRSILLKSSTFYLLAIYALISVMISLYLYARAQETSLQRIRETVVSIASVGALQIQSSELAELQTKNDSIKPVYEKIIMQLREIRQQNPNVIYAYIIRPTINPLEFIFIADADADPNNTEATADTNRDGYINDADQIGTLGLSYNVSGKDVLESGEYQRPIANRKPYSDQWGSFITGYAPIKDLQGNIQGILAVDMWASKIQEFTAEAFSPIIFSIIVFGSFLLLRFWAINKSVLSELKKIWNSWLRKHDKKDLNTR